jgi:glycosyltransferase involved in cell wall biosynthesis
MTDRNIIILSDRIFNDEKGGAERVVFEYTRAFVKKGYSVKLLTPKRSRRPSRENVDGIEVYRYGNMSSPDFVSGLMTFLSGTLLFLRLSAEEKPRLVILNQPYSGLVALFSRLTRKFPLLYIFYSPWAEEYALSNSRNSWIGRQIRFYIEKLVTASSNTIVCLSKFSERQLARAHKGSEGRTRVVDPGVDMEKFIPGEKGPARNILKLPQDKLVLLTVRRLVPRMGIENLIRAFKTASDARGGMYLVIAGDGPCRSAYERLTSQLGLDGFIRFDGFVDDALLPAYYRAADLFVLPTRALEGFGLVTLESLACGTPVLATPVGATPEILCRFDKRLLFAGSSAEEIASGTLKFIPEYLKNYRTCRIQCRDFVQMNFSWDAFSSRIEEITNE